MILVKESSINYEVNEQPVKLIAKHVLSSSITILLLYLIYFYGINYLIIQNYLYIT